MKIFKIIYLIFVSKCLSDDLTGYVLGPYRGCYKFYKANITWDQAKRECNSSGHDLVIITSKDDNSWFSDQANLAFGQGSFWWANAKGIYNDSKHMYNNWDNHNKTSMGLLGFVEPIIHNSTSCMAVNVPIGHFYTEHCNETYCNYICFYMPTDGGCPVTTTTATTTINPITTNYPINYKNHTWIILLAVGLFLLIFIILIMIYCILRYRTKRRQQLIEKLAREMQVQPTVKGEPKEKKDDFWIEEKRLEVVYEEPLGTGFSSNVYVGKLFGASVLAPLNVKTTKFRDCRVAIKIANEYGNNESVILESEIETMKKIGYHEYIVPMLGWSIKQNKPCLVLELCEGNLLNYVKGNLEVQFKNLISILWQIVQGMEYLVSKRLVHRDLAARNILLVENRIAKITDFGLCCTCDDATLSYQASLQKKLPMRWLSLEALLHRTFSEKSDVWAFGILMSEVFSGGKVPYATMEADEILEFLKSGKRLECPEMSTDEVYEIMCSCWEENVETRVSFSELSTKLRSILLSETQDYGYIFGKE